MSECCIKTEDGTILEKLGSHEWQHFKFVENTTTRFNPRKPFTLAYYCRKCLEVCVKAYEPLVKDVN